MGLFSWFWKSNPTQKAIEKQALKAKEAYAQPEYRKMAMEKLLGWNTKESFKAVLGRFSVVVQSPHWDEEEKNWLVKELVEKGDLAKEVLSEYVLSSHEVTHACIALSKLCSKEEYAELLTRALESHHPEEYRFSQAKMELVAQLAEVDAGGLELDGILLPYLGDHNDDVQCMVLDVIAQHRLQKAYPALLQVLLDTARSARVLRHAAKHVADLKIPIEDNQALPTEVAEDYHVVGQILVSRHV